MLSEEQDEIRIFIEQYVKLIKMWLGTNFKRNNSYDNLQYAYKIKRQLDLVKQLDSSRTLATSTTDDSKAFQDTDYSKNLEEIEDGLSVLISVWENEISHEQSINLSNKIRSHGAKPFMTKKTKLMLGSIAAALLSGALNTKTNDMTSRIINKNQIDPLIQQLQVETNNYVDLPDIGTPSTSGSGEFENIMGKEMVPFEMGTEVVPFKMGTEVVPFEMGTGVVPFEMGTGMVPSNNNVDKYGVPRGAQYGDDSSTVTMLPPPHQYETFDDVSTDVVPFGMGTGMVPSNNNESSGGRGSLRKLRRAHKRRSCKKRKSRRRRQSSRRRKSRVSRK